MWLSPKDDVSWEEGTKRGCDLEMLSRGKKKGDLSRCSEIMENVRLTTINHYPLKGPKQG